MAQSAGVITGWTNDGSLGSSMTPTGSPTYLANAVNGLPGVQFVYANNLTSVSALTLGGGSGQQSFVLLCRADAYANTPSFINHGLTTTDGLGVSVGNTGSGIEGRIDGLGDGYTGGSRPPTVKSAIGAFSGTAWHVLRVDLGAALLIELDGLALTPSASFAGATPSFSSTLKLGNCSISLAAVVAGLDVGDALLDKAVGKLAWDAGITLDAGHPYAGARP